MSPTKTISKQRSVLAEHSSPISPPSSPPASPLFPPLDPYDIETILDNLMTLSEERIIAFFTAFEQFQIDKVCFCVLFFAFGVFYSNFFFFSAQ